MEVACRALLATVFVGAAAGKVLGKAALRAFVASLREMAVLPSTLVGPAARVNVALEMLIAVLLLVPYEWAAQTGFVLAAGLLSVFTLAIARTLASGRRTTCRCFGASTVPLGRRHVLRNLVLIAVAATGLAATVVGGGSGLGPALVGATAGLVLGVLVVELDDLTVLIRPLR